MARTVTVLFTDAVEPNESSRVALLEALGKAAAAQGSSDVSTLATGLVASFGAATLAVKAAVALQQELAAMNRASSAAPIGPRVGLHVGELGDDDSTAKQLGTLDVARRLCERASSGQIIVSPLVRGLLGSWNEYEFRELPPHALDASPRLEGYEVLWASEPAAAVPLPMALARLARYSFIGRDAELKRVRDAWTSARDGAGRIVLIAGEPGIGKTRLVTELAREAHGDGGVVLFGRCDDEMLIPYQPFVEALDHYVTGSRPEHIRELLGSLGGELTRLLPGLDQRVPGLPPPFRGEPETERYRMFEAVSALLRRASQRQPLLLVIDDLHWADKPSLLLLRHIARTPGAAGILTVGTYRDSELTPTHALADVLAELRRDGLFERVALRGLGPGEAKDLIDAAVGGHVSSELAENVHWETEGNPYFIEEVARHLVETDAIVEEQGTWTARVPVEQVGIPEGVKEVVGRRLARTSPECNHALMLASVVGQEFDLRAIEPVANLDEDALLLALEEAVRAALLTELPDNIGRFRFSHALVRETLYGQLGTLRRASMHSAIGAALEDMYANDIESHLPELAHHFCQAALAGDVDKAVSYARRAGDQALTVLGYEEAAGYYDRALSALEVRGPDDERGRLLLRLGEAQLKAGEMAVAKASFLEAADRARSMHDAELLAEAALGRAASMGGVLSTQSPGGVDLDLVHLLEDALQELPPGDSVLRVRTMGRLATALYYTAGAEERRRDLADESVAMAERLRDTPVLAAALSAQHLALWGPGNLHARLSAATQMLSVAEGMGERELMLEARQLRLMDLLELGDVPAAESEFDAHDRESRELHQPVYEWYTMMLRGMRALLFGRWSEAEQTITETLATGNRIGNPQAFNYYSAQLFALWAGTGALLEQGEAVLAGLDQAARDYAPARCAAAYLNSEFGRLDEGRALLAELAKDDFSAIPPDSTWPISMRFLAETCALIGDRELSRTLYERLLPHAGRVFVAGPPPIACFGLASHSLGLLAQTAADPEAAAHHLEDAYEQAVRTGTAPFEAEALLARGELLLSQGDVDRARAALGRALVRAEELGMARIAARARDALAGR